MKTPSKPDLFIDGKYIVLNYACEYDIPLSDLMREDRIIFWAEHLSGKTWMSEWKMREFLKLACLHNKVPIPSIFTKENLTFLFKNYGLPGYSR